MTANGRGFKLIRSRSAKLTAPVSALVRSACVPNDSRRPRRLGRLTSTRPSAPLVCSMPRTDPLPIEAVRDLLGITRALFAARKREHAPAAELEELRTIGSDLVKALDLARKTKPDTVGHRAAWDRAEMATERLMRIVGPMVTAGAVVEAA